MSQEFPQLFSKVVENGVRFKKSLRKNADMQFSSRSIRWYHMKTGEVVAEKNKVLNKKKSESSEKISNKKINPINFRNPRI